MKHDKLMKYPKRFCVECDSNQYVFTLTHKKFVMYHCQRCKAEIARAGDGQQPSSIRRVAGGIDVNSFSGNFLSGKSSEVLASEYPDVLSDDHHLWPARDFDAEAVREDHLRTFKIALSNLTARQAQILEAIDMHGTHEKAALALGVRKSTITDAVEQIRKKLAKSTGQAGGKGIQGEQSL